MASTTNYLGMTKPDYTDPVDIQVLNDNFDKIDDQIGFVTKKSVSSYTKIWEYQTGQAVYSTPIVTTYSNGKKVVVFQGWDWYVYAIDFASGTLLWRYATGGNCYGRCQAADVNGDGKTEVIAVSHDGTIYCLNESGTVLWTFKNIYDREGSGTISSAGSYYFIDTTKSWVANSFQRGSQGLNASVQITSGTGAEQILEISGIDSSNPSKMWTFNNWTTMPDATSQYKIVPKYSSDIFYQHAGTLNQENGTWYLYVTGFDGQCCKINASSGAIIWKFSALENIEPFPVITDINKDGALECLFVSIDKNVYCLNATTGAQIWKTTLGDANDAFSSYGDIDNDGVIEFVVTSRSNRCYILNGNSGAIKHLSTDVGGDIDTQPVLFDINGDGYKEIIFGCDSGYIYCLDYQANTIWRFLQGTGINASTNVADINNDGMMEILTPDMNGTVSVLNPQGVEIGQIHMKGSIEGTPLVGDLNSDGGLRMILTSVDGYVRLIKFR